MSDELADATVLWAWPDAVELVVRAAGLFDRSRKDYDERFARAVVVTLAADDGRVENDWARDKLVWFATAAVPGLLDDLREARSMARAMDAERFADFLASSTKWPAAPPIVLRALVGLRPELRRVIERRATHLGHPNPLDHPQPLEAPQ